MNFKKIMLWLQENRRKAPLAHLPFNEIHSILLRPLGNAIGDAAVHTAHLSQLRTLFPNAKLGVIVTPQNRTVFEHCGLVDEFIERHFISFIKQHKKWDLLLDFENNFNSFSLLADRILMPKYIAIFYKYNKKHYNLNNVKSYDFHYPQPKNGALSHYLHYSDFSKLNLPDPYSIIKTQLEKDRFSDTLWENEKIRILLCPQGSKREIPPEELVDLLHKSTNKYIIKSVEFMISYTENSSDYLSRMQKAGIQLNLKLSPKTTLSEYFSLIKSADVVIAVDGGSLHLACALKKPLLSFFANSQPNLGTWQPLVYPDIPHCRVLTREYVGSDSNATRDFELEPAVEWLRLAYMKFTK